MAVARRFTERVATALLSLVATAMAIGGVALAGMGATLRATPMDMEGMPVITVGLMAVGAVLAKILVLVFLIIFIQRRPRGLFPQKGRAAEN